MGTTASTAESPREQVLRRLRDDHEFFAANAVTIVDKSGSVVPFIYKEPQRRFTQALEAQRDAGQPMRGIVLKARQIGFSTQAQGMLIQRATTRPHHNALVAAHSGKTVGALFRMGKGIYGRLPSEIRPRIAYDNNSQGRQYIHWGEASRNLRHQGIVGLESSYTVATAKEAQDGRGLTFRTVHLSEVAFWDGEGMMLGVAQAVPDDPDTLIVMESTANGENFFKDFWDAAVAGENGYLPFFTPWFEEPGYRRPFANELDRDEFRARLGEGEAGADEKKLQGLIRAYWGEHTDLTSAELDDLVLEFLHWRRWAIAAKTLRSVEKFHQEYPSTPEEAFLSTGRKVFAAAHVARVRKNVEATDPVSKTFENTGPVRGAFKGDKVKVVAGRNGTKFEVPQSALWVPASKLEAHERPHWRVWAAPQKEQQRSDGTKVPEGQYIVANDPMSGEDNDGALANHAIQVIDHRTLRQVAEYESQADPDQVALELLLVALRYNRAHIAVETTGGWGLPIVRRLARDYHYPRLYTREQEDKRVENIEDRLGWSTDARTKPLLLARGQQLLREEVDGIRSRVLAQQLGWYIIDERGRSGPMPGKNADVLLAWLIAQEVAARKPIRPDRPRGAISTTGGRSITIG